MFSGDSEIESLLNLSARIGQDPLLVQAGNGNTSIKLNGSLWIKASGKWLANAVREDILVALDLPVARLCVHNSKDPSIHCLPHTGGALQASIETAMHVVIPRRFVIHVHSINTIAFAVRLDGQEHLATRLASLHWKWIPYTPSGLPLAREIERAVSKDPRTNVFVLENHGLVVCGDDCSQAERLLREVEYRVSVMPRISPQADWNRLSKIAAAMECHVPSEAIVHSLGTDPISRRVFCHGILYPCQAVFLGIKPNVLTKTNWSGCFCQNAGAKKFTLLPGAGVVISKRLTRTEFITLAGLAQVLQRIPARAPLRYLSIMEVLPLLDAAALQYRERVEQSGEAVARLGSDTSNPAYSSVAGSK